ncbi:Predicted oxidoreductase [Lentzea xinjiangensis]|uniref:Predicted oxidoreductase n=1 Tax=Lentzea xinjiangensis TaxID=402600 RepID=A0A1H9KS04_9PSEU|nr:aldo/keto reductase [Lentzea xinjiangensis]SER01956.1 Predicted oxidoreductase [Lentzea xinjiangensis]
MRMRVLGRTGIEVSPYCLGTMMFGQVGNPDHDECVRIVHRALDFGINFVDTADVYSYGETEEIVGKALRGRRDEVVLATKVNGVMGEGHNRSGSSRRWIIAEVEHSLRRLQTDYIDLYQVHHPDPRTDVEETLSALTDLVRAGKVRAIGCSNLPAVEIVEAQWASERRGLERFRTEQPHYSILNRGVERDVLPVCERYGMGALVWSPLAGGLLTGRYRKDRPPNGHAARMRWLPRHMTDENKLDAVERLLPVAQQAGMSLTHLAMAFAVAHPAVTSAIIGPRTTAQLDDLLAGAGTVLDDGLLDRIDEVVPPGTDLGALDIAYVPPSLAKPGLRRRPPGDRPAA